MSELSGRAYVSCNHEAFLNNVEGLFYELIRVSIGKGKALSHNPSEKEWAELFDFSKKQAVAGVAFLALDQLSKYGQKPPISLLFEWIGLSEQIKAENEILNNRCREVSKILSDAGFESCILKGQGNAEMYPDSMSRTPGDIDVWVDADEKTVCEFVRERYPEAVESYKHIKFPMFDDVLVDVHVTPLKFYCSKYDKRLQRWISEHKKEQFEHRIQLSESEKEINVPTARFNAVYQLGHMLIHLYDEGIGLRHLVDYYYVLKNLDVFDKEREEIVRVLKSLGMLRFAKAVMWIEKETLGLVDECCFIDTDEKLGRKLLDDVLEGGNFGKYSERYRGRNGFYWMGMVEAKRILELMDFAPCEAGFCLLRKTRTAIRHGIQQ